MTPKEILEKAFDSDLEVLHKAYESDIELAKNMNKDMKIIATAIWTALIDKGIVTFGEAQGYVKEAEKQAEPLKEESHE